MKIAINTRFLIKDRLEGIGRYTHEVCKWMVENHPDVEFHFLFDRPFDERFLFGKNVRGHVLFPPARHPLLWQWWFEWSVPRKMKEIGAEAFFSPDGYASLSTDVPTAMTTHDVAYIHFPEQIRNSHLRYFKKYIPRFHHRADRIICVSKHTRKDVLTQFDIDQKKTIIIPNGVYQGFRPLPEEEKRRVREKITNGAEFIVIVGAIHPRKNVLRQIKAFELFKKNTSGDTKLVLAGRWAWQYDEVKAAIQKSPNRRDIVHLPNVKDMASVLGAAMALSYVSLYEGFGMPILEAFRAEVPVITSNRSSMPEVAGDAALLVNPENVNEIAAAIIRVSSDQRLRSDLVTKGKMQAQKFSWDSSAERVFVELAKLSQHPDYGDGRGI